MKTILTSLTMMLLISILAVCAYAQNEEPAQSHVQLKPEEPVKELTLDRAVTGETSEGVGTVERSHAWNGPESMGAAAEEQGGDDLLKSAGDEDGEKIRKHYFDDEWGNGGTVRNDDYAEEGGPHGPIGDNGIGPDDDPGNDENGDDMLKVFLDENCDGFNDLTKTFGEDCDGTQTQDGALENERETHGPGEAGPYVDNANFGTANDQDVGTGSVIRDRGSRRK